MVPNISCGEKASTVSLAVNSMNNETTYQGECAHMQTSSATTMGNPLLPNGFEDHPTFRNPYDGNPSQKPTARKSQSED